jgi:RNA polymerase sigma factor (sigma-70 family)
MSVLSGPHDGGIDIPVARRRIPARLLRLASDERLVELLRGGSEPAFEALFDRHHRGVLGFCRHMLGSVEEAEDAVQHTFLAAYRELVGSRKTVVLRPWLYTIARNRCLTALRTRARQSMGELHDPPTEHLAAEVERRQDLRCLLGDVARLPDDQRAALVLSELGDMSHDEIADVLGCRREKVKALVFQARSSLIASRAARDTPCDEIREQLANLRGGSLRRNEVRRHLTDCAGCREFRAQVRRQRRDLALVLPVAPTVGLKATVIGGGTALMAGGGVGTVATKVLVVAAIVGSGTAAVEIKSADDRIQATTAPGAARPTEAGARYQPAATHAHRPVARPVDGRANPASPAPAERPGKRVKAVHPAKPAHPHHPAKPAHPQHPAKPIHPEHPAKPIHPEHPTKPIHPEHPAKAAPPAKAAKPVEPSTSSKPVAPEKPLHPSRAAAPWRRSKAPKPVEPAVPAVPAKPLKPAKAQHTES